MTTSPRAPSRAAVSASFALALLLSSLAVPAPAERLPAPRPIPRQAAAPSPQSRLQVLLAKAADYCRKLEDSAFDLVCREEIVERVDPSLDVAKKGPPPVSAWTKYQGPTLTISTVGKVKKRYIYDYQCVRAGRTIRETRAQLEENGKRKVVPNAELTTSVIAFSTALLAPVALFGERFQPGYDFTVAGEETIGQTKVLVIDVRPKPGVPPARNLYGKAWVDPDTGDILKIEWSESRAGSFDVFEKRGQIYKRKPRLVIRSEFGAEKNGIRFPSHMFIEEAYLKDPGKVFVRSKTDVVYKDFKFSTVEVDVRK